MLDSVDRWMRIALQREMAADEKYLKNHSKEACQQDDKEKCVPII